jgi:hypothetical protein
VTSAPVQRSAIRSSSGLANWTGRRELDALAAARATGARRPEPISQNCVFAVRVSGPALVARCPRRRAPVRRGATVERPAFVVPQRNARGERRDQGRTLVDGAGVRLRRPPRRAAHRRTRPRRGRIAMEIPGEHAGLRRALSVRAPREPECAGQRIWEHYGPSGALRQPDRSDHKM